MVEPEGSTRRSRVGTQSDLALRAHSVCVSRQWRSQRLAWSRLMLLPVLLLPLDLATWRGFSVCRFYLVSRHVTKEAGYRRCVHTQQPVHVDGGVVLPDGVELDIPVGVGRL